MTRNLRGSLLIASMLDRRVGDDVGGVLLSPPDLQLATRRIPAASGGYYGSSQGVLRWRGRLRHDRRGLYNQGQGGYTQPGYYGGQPGYDFGRPGYNPGGLGGPASGIGVRPGMAPAASARGADRPQGSPSNTRDSPARGRLPCGRARLAADSNFNPCGRASLR